MSVELGTKQVVDYEVTVFRDLSETCNFLKVCIEGVVLHYWKSYFIFDYYNLYFVRPI